MKEKNYNTITSESGFVITNALTSCSEASLLEIWNLVDSEDLVQALVNCL